MNRFFIELYLDEDVDVLVADLLRARGFVATMTRDAGKLQRASRGSSCKRFSRLGESQWLRGPGRPSPLRP